MICALLLTVLLDVQDVPFEKAEALAREGQHAEALDAFQQLVSANPRDLRGRMWIARLHGLMGNPELAEPVYRSITLEDPGSIEAALGLGNTLLALGRPDDAIEVLQRAESLDPRATDTLLALSRAHRMAGNTARAVRYSEVAVQASPGGASQQTLEAARRVHDHRVELSSFGEQYDTGVEDTASGDLLVNMRAANRLRLVARGQYQRKFRVSDQRGGGGFEWQWRRDTSIASSVLIGPGNLVLPRVDAHSAIAHTYGPALWTASYRFVDFSSAHVSVLSPMVTWWATPRVSFDAEYHLALTQFDAVAGTTDNHSGTLRMAYQLTPRLGVTVAGTRGVEDFDSLSPDRIGAFQATTAEGGVRLDLRSLTSVQAVYQHQWRRGSIEMHRLRIGLVQRF